MLIQGEPVSGSLFITAEIKPFSYFSQETGKKNKKTEKKEEAGEGENRRREKREERRNRREEARNKKQERREKTGVSEKNKKRINNN